MDLGFIMNIFKQLVFASILIIFSATSSAKDYTFTVDLDFYINGGYSLLGYQLAGAETADSKILYLNAGVSIFDYVSLEARIGQGMQEDKVLLLDQGVMMEVDVGNYQGMYISVGCPHIMPFYPYAFGGYSEIDADINLGGYGKVSETHSGFSYGMGMDFSIAGFNSIPTWLNWMGFEFSRWNMPENVLLNFEYLQYLDDSAVSVGGFNLGVKYYF